MITDAYSVCYVAWLKYIMFRVVISVILTYRPQGVIGEKSTFPNRSERYLVPADYPLLKETKYNSRHLLSSFQDGVDDKWEKDRGVALYGDEPGILFDFPPRDRFPQPCPA